MKLLKFNTMDNFNTDVKKTCEAFRHASGRGADLHVQVLKGQAEVGQVVVSRCVSVCVEAGGEVTAGHRNPHHRVADACITDTGWRWTKYKDIMTPAKRQ